MDFPKDIILELLLRLPVKSFMRFKCVSSEWNDMISDAAFRKNWKTNQPASFTMVFHSIYPKKAMLGQPSSSTLPMSTGRN
ncbi:hypothetical protein RHGRI_022975 [Rhododendron griersonianum]|uniref:F-box domain-containing protein n=1 Tax=Rhododendron griersonianum TaxID=479676 RepID=A0AAV6J6S9_9ERIC|nr:hypothetical protein RHGRI_022975 [Rhododendron griersonianum]